MGVGPGVGELQRAEPTWGLGVRTVEVLGEGEFRLASEPLPFPLLVKAGEVGEGVANLRQVLPEVTRRWRGIGSVDLRLPRRLVVQHAGEVPPAPVVVAAVVAPTPVAPESIEPEVGSDGGLEPGAGFQSSAAIRGLVNRSEFSSHCPDASSRMLRRINGGRPPRKA